MTAISHLKSQLDTLVERLSSDTYQPHYKSKFSLGSLDEQVGRINAFRKVCESMGNTNNFQGIDLDKSLTRAFLCYNQMRFVDDSFLEGMGDGDIVEIISLEHQHLFCSPRVFEITNYDLETLMLIPWDRLFERDDQTMEDLFSFLNLVLASRLGKAKPPENKHLMFETIAENPQAFEFQIKWIGCVTDDKSDRLVGYATIVRPHCLGDRSKFTFIKKRP